MFKNLIKEKKILEYIFSTIGDVLMLLWFSQDDTMYTKDGPFSELSKVYGIILNSPMKGFNFFFNDILIGRAKISNAYKTSGKNAWRRH